ncbi:50S ribosomal protein L25 [bacterium endosymbiont of Pedicinus badii]|uniref:50S ribosomal protein L25 n=1 Tax=bacterium endosymbiont of Pedicinus badii TaxID=1719126 RepID=UPI0009B98E82|nr:50S ribosomal protein L25 [bacterium endosymbiont of Pedicinus badii]OQM34439.1 hypothetical protein AOQ89_00940 [bacterium endosymbiont of Pedicinus badii]
MLTIQAKIRKLLGKLNSKKIRKDNLIPAVLYEKNKKSISVFLKNKDIINAKKKENFYKNTINLYIENTVRKVKIQYIQWHPFKEKIMHIEFKIIK